MAKKETITYEDIVRDVRAGRFSPVYYLMGEESYYIDRISDYIVNMALKEEEKDFNLTILYGGETTASVVINAAKRYPMMAERQVVLVREAQQLSGKEALLHYLKQPQPSTILVFCHKHGVLDRRQKLAAELQRVGVLFESKKMYESNLPSFVSSYMKRKGYAIEPEAASMVSDCIGSDLTRISSELDKLVLALPDSAQRVTPKLVEQYIGISKEFNNFELVNALVDKDVLKVNQIVKYFDSNPKGFLLPLTLSVLYNYFSNLMLAYYAPQRTEQGIADWTGQPVWAVRKNILPGMKNYTGVKVMNILSELRKTDAKSKGVGNPSTSHGELLGDLVHYILH